jgi:hypothetical protein
MARATLSKDDDGVTRIQFEYSLSQVITTYSIQANITSVDVDSLSAAFKDAEFMARATWHARPTVLRQTRLLVAFHLAQDRIIQELYDKQG